MNDAGDCQERSLFVSWRDPKIGSIHPIGRLVRRNGPQGAEHYSFAYLKWVRLSWRDYAAAGTTPLA